MVLRRLEYYKIILFVNWHPKEIRKLTFRALALKPFVGANRGSAHSRARVLRISNSVELEAVDLLAVTSHNVHTRDILVKLLLKTIFSVR